MTASSASIDRSAAVVPLAIPVLLTTDPDRALATYEAIGFTVIRPAPGYLIARGFGAEFHISQVSEIPLPHCVSAYLRVPDVAALFDSFAKANAKLTPPADKPWGLREFHFVDGDGNLINVGQIID